MKKIFLLLICFSLICHCYAQNTHADSLLVEMGKAKNDSIRVRLMNTIIYKTPDMSQQNRIDYSKKILNLAKSNNDKILEAIITAEIGYILAINGNSLEGAELCFRALEMAERVNSKLALGIIYQDLAVCYIDDTVRSIKFIHKAIPNSSAAGEYSNYTASLGTLARFYSTEQYKDSALYYAQRAYEVALAHNVEENLPSTLATLAEINYTFYHNKGLAFEYARSALHTSLGKKIPDLYIRSTSKLADLFLKEGQRDSALYYIYLSNPYLKEVRYNVLLDVYDLFKRYYLNTNADSALKYFQAYESLKNSTGKLSNIQQKQLLSIKRELDIEAISAERQQNIQYALIVLGIIILISLYLLLSRSFITNTKLIEFFGVITLLIVFEFLNLLLHPFLERVTHHSPILMLLALVCIAALLVPLHHKVEKWATHKLVEKNKQVRLANAKKTIEELENIKTN